MLPKNLLQKIANSFPKKGLCSDYLFLAELVWVLFEHIEKELVGYRGREFPAFYPLIQNAKVLLPELEASPVQI